MGFTVAYLLTGSVEIAGGIALVEPCVNAMAFFFHERAWKHDWAGTLGGFCRAVPGSRPSGSAS